MPSEPISFEDAVESAIERDARYQPEAYAFVRDALHVASKKFRGEGDDQHVTGQELLEGVREHALREFGPMALFLLREWGITRGEDVGAIVYNLIECSYFGKNDGDSIEDFAGGYDFEQAFTQPFLPVARAEQKQKTNS
ncbi:MAG: hypothetical protein K1X78_02840 [Verrucomicrobiaceae bacterium]|nr:hypothetical protein [Verrucomicrobiaceae bacterium]